MTGSSAGQQPAETHPTDADPAAPADVFTAGDTGPSTGVPAQGGAASVGARASADARNPDDVRTADDVRRAEEIRRPEDVRRTQDVRSANDLRTAEDVFEAAESRDGGDVRPTGEVRTAGEAVAPKDVPESGPAPQRRPKPRFEPAPAGPFGGASPAPGSAWLGTPGTLPGPAGIEPTTGAPLAMLPQRAPRATVPADLPAWDGPTASMPTAPPGTDPGTDDDGEDFWLPIEEVHWDGTPVQPIPRTWYGRPKKTPGEAALARRARPPKPQRNPAFGLASVILFSLLASFFAWVSAEPLWLAVGHGEPGTATVASCTGRGVGQHCRGEFTASSGLFTARDVRLVGVDGGGRDIGARLAARMTDADSHKAYVGTGSGLLHLRWALGFGFILLCCAGTGWASGALRLADRRSRHRAALVSVAGPLLLTAGFLAAAY